MNAKKTLQSRMTRKLISQYALALTAYIGGFIIIVLAAWWVCAQKTWYYDDPLWNFLTAVRDNIVLIGMVVCLAGWLAITYYFLAKPLKYLDEAVLASTQLAELSEKPIKLSEELKSVEDEMNMVRETALLNARHAKEAEQRKNDLIVYLAHDLKTPLTSIVGYLTLLKEAPELPAEYRAKYTDITLEKAYRLEQLINEFFDITRFNLQSIALESNHIDLTMMISQMAEEFYPVLKERGLSCNVSIQSRIHIVGDADKLSRVFDNLMRNAVSYSYPNSQITISAHTQNGKVIITFKNRGDRIPEQKLNMIFEKFFRADNARTSTTGGAGLGLAIAKQIVELHGGTITAQSDDYYTTFTVTLNL